MANINLKYWDNHDMIQGRENPSLQIDAVVITGRFRMVANVLPGSISLVSAAVPCILTSGASVGISLGIYTLNGATLTLVNSASGSMLNALLTAYANVTLATSATTVLSSGVNYFGWLISATTTAANGVRMAVYDNVCDDIMGANQPYAGNFFFGISSASTTALPSSVDTAGFAPLDNTVVTADNFNLSPYLIISAQ